jgi:hypothetical protein
LPAWRAENTGIVEETLWRMILRNMKRIRLIRLPDSFRKIVVVRDYMKPWKDENGIQYIGIEDFLLDESIVFR